MQDDNANRERHDEPAEDAPPDPTGLSTGSGADDEPTQESDGDRSEEVVLAEEIGYGSVGESSELDEAPEIEAALTAEQVAADESSGGELETVRELLLGPEWDRLIDARRRFEDPAAHAAEIAKALPGAVAIRAAQDGSLGEALAPTIEHSLQTSVRQHPQAIVDAIFPVMGPAIRKSVADTFLRAIQGLNEALEQSLTLRGLGWRIESWRTGRPYAEVVMLHTLSFRVEQVFLIHRETGLLLQHLQAESVAGQDPDMVSGMLTAIQDFVKDSFHDTNPDSPDRTRGATEALNSMRVGTMTVWIEHAPRAILAVAIRGTPKQALRQTMQEALEGVSATMAEALEHFQGDPSVFAPCRLDLEAVLVEQRRDGGSGKKKRNTLLAWIVIGTLAALLAWWLFSRWVDRRNFDRFVEGVEALPGVLVTRTDTVGGVRHIYGLRDPFAQDPTSLDSYTKLDPNRVRIEMEQHQSSEPAFVLYKSKAILRPPTSITLAFDAGVLMAGGQTSNKWLAFARARALLIPGVTKFDESRVTNTTLPALNALKQRIEARKPRFIVNTTDLSPGQDAMFRDLVKDVKELVQLAIEQDVGLRVEIIGHTDSTGAEAKNMRLSMQRSEQVAAVLVTAGVNNDFITPLGVGATDPIIEDESNNKDREANRRVSLRVVLRP